MVKIFSSTIGQMHQQHLLCVCTWRPSMAVVCHLVAHHCKGGLLHTPWPWPLSTYPAHGVCDLLYTSVSVIICSCKVRERSCQFIFVDHPEFLILYITTRKWKDEEVNEVEPPGPHCIIACLHCWKWLLVDNGLLGSGAGGVRVACVCQASTMNL